MVDNIEKAIRPLFLVSFIFGFGILRYPLNRLRVHLSICYMLTIWSVYACGFYYYMSFMPHIFKIFNLTYFLLITNWLTTMISIIITVCECEKFWICIRKLGLVDHTLEELGTPKEYHRMRNSIKWALLMWLTMICVTWTSSIFWYKKIFNDIKAIIIPFIMDYSLYVNTWIDIMFAFILRYIGTKLDKINEYIEQMVKTEECGLRCTWQKSLIVIQPYIRSKNNQRVLWTVMHLHSELCRVAHDINCLFGIQMTVQMLIYFAALIEMFYFQFLTLLCTPQMYGNTIRLQILLWDDMWLIIFLTKLISLNRICESVSTKAQKTKNVIHKLTNFICFAEAREEICQFVLQISLRPLRFSAMGLFYFGYNFIRKLFIWILATIVIILQMDESPISRMMTSNANNITIICYN